jgi:hypothetical protein
VASDVPLTSTYPRPDAAFQPVTNIAAGHARRVYLLGVGGAAGLAAGLHGELNGSVLEPETVYGAAVVSSAGLGVVHWMRLDHLYDVEIVVTGRNFDAARFRGQVRVRTERLTDQGEVDPSPQAEVTSLEVEWAHQLVRYAK